MARRAKNALAARPIARDDDNAPTQRNLLPWKEMEKLLAAKLAAKAARGEISTEFLRDDEIPAPPDSGVRASIKTRIEPDHDDDPHRPLSYSVYTVAELDDLAVSRSESKPEPLVQAPVPTTWTDVARAAGGVVRAFGLWARTAKPRPRMLDICGVPLVAFRADLGRALTVLPWKKIAAAAVAACVVMVVAFVSVAELTDESRPVKRDSTASATPEPATIELDDDAPAVTDTATDNAGASPAAAASAPAAKARLVHPSPVPPLRPKAKKPKHDLFNP